MKRIGALSVVVVMLLFAAGCVVEESRPAYPDRGPSYSDRFFQRIDNQQQRINKGVAAGDLTRREAGDLQSNLERIKHRYNRMAADGYLTDAEVRRLEGLLDQNSEMIRDKRSNPVRTFGDREIDPGYGRDDHRPAAPDGYHKRIEDQQQRIDKGVASGDLTRKEAGDLQKNLDLIKRRYDAMRIDGRLNDAERISLDRMLDRNGEMIANKRSNRVRAFDDADFDIQGRIDTQQKRIEQGIAAKQLTRREADQVQDNLDWIRKRYRQMKADGKLSQGEIEKLDRMLDENSAMIHDARKNAPRRLY